MQESLELKAKGGIKVPVEVNRRAENKKAALFIHGFTGHINEHFHYNAAQEFPKHGIDVWRVGLYPGEPGMRSMATVKWSEHLEDIALVIKKMERTYGKIFLVGHSKGGTLATYVNHPKIAAKVLWDPPTRDYDHKRDDAYKINRDYITIDWGHLIAVKKSYAKDSDDASMYAGKFAPQPPMLIVHVSDGVFQKKLWPMKKLPAKLVYIPHCDHCFNNEGNEKKLFDETLKFLKGVR